MTVVPQPQEEETMPHFYNTKTSVPRRHRGMFFLITVLVAFELLSIVSATILSANWYTLRSESVLAGEKSVSAGPRGTMLARSMVIAAAEIISAAASSSDSTLNSNTITINDGNTKLYSKVSVSRTDNKYTITSKVSTESTFPSNSTKTCSSKAVYVKGGSLTWDE